MRLSLVVLLVACGGATETTPDEPSADGAVTDGAFTDSAVTDSAVAETESRDTGAAVDTAAPVDSSVDTPAACGCASYTEPSSAGTISGGGVSEISGLALGRASPGVIWTHNDSGDSARLFALDTAGAILGELRVTGATAVDWEDIAIGPCAAGSCIYVGDFGDNGMARTNDALYRIPEPKLEPKPFAARSVAAEKIPFTYPDGRWNAEALLVHPTTGEIVIVTKGASPGVYRFPSPLTAGAAVVLKRVSTPAGLDGVVTGGDVSPCGDRALLRTYSSLFEYRLTTLADGLGDGLAKLPVKVPVGKEGQGEAVTYRADGRGYFTASEGSSVPLYATSCK